MTVKRHAEWSALTVKLCRQCLQEHVQQYVIRYPVQAFGQETCECPCQCSGNGMAELPAVGQQQAQITTQARSARASGQIRRAVHSVKERNVQSTHSSTRNRAATG